MNLQQDNTLYKIGDNKDIHQHKDKKNLELYVRELIVQLKVSQNK